jgi:hypothetical protein
MNSSRFVKEHESELEFLMLYRMMVFPLARLVCIEDGTSVVEV